MSEIEAGAEGWASRRRFLLTIVLIGVGMLRVLGHLSGLFPFSILGLQYGSSPLPLVFSRVRGIDTYARRFAIEIRWADGRSQRILGDPQLVQRLGGPFTRYKVYIDELAYADLSPVRRSHAVLVHAFCNAGPMAQSLGIDDAIASVRLELWNVGSSDPPSRYDARCDP